MFACIYASKILWTLTDFRVLGFPEQDLTIFRKCLSVCMSPKFCGHCISRTNAWKLIKLYIQLDLDIIWCVLDLMLLFKKSWCCSKCLISLTQWYRTKLLENVPNTNYFILIVLKFRKFFYNSKNKIIHNFLMYWANTSPKGWGK